MFPLLERNVPHIEEKILSYLEPRDLAASRLVCREWSCKAKPFLCEWYEVKQRNEGRVPLIEATRHGYVDLVAYLLKDEQLDVNECHYMWPALVCEAHGGHVEIIKLLLQREDINVNVNATDLFGQTPLIWAACKGHASIAECLLHHIQTSTLTERVMTLKEEPWTMQIRTAEIMLGVTLTMENGKLRQCWRRDMLKARL